MDEKIIIVSERMPDEFELKVNEVLKSSPARVVQTEMSVTDHHYYAMIVVQSASTDEGVTKTNRAHEAGVVKELKVIRDLIRTHLQFSNHSAVLEDAAYLLSELIQKREGLNQS